MGGMTAGAYGLSRDEDDDDLYQQQLYEQEQLQELESGGLARQDRSAPVQQEK